MPTSNITSIILLLLSLTYSLYSLDYSDLEALGITCSPEDKCENYNFNESYTDRSCECDYSCTTYEDCCIDYRGRPSSRMVLSRMTCLNIGENYHTGVYVIANCSNTWRGSAQIRRKCEGPDDFSDPLLAVPVTSTAQATTYRNSYCAECNNAAMNSLKYFHIKMACPGLQGLSEEQIFADITYSRQFQAWGVNRLNSFGNATNFYACAIIFDAPSYLHTNLRFCRANLISTCDPLWTRNHVREYCAEYMAVVYDNTMAYRNPHCALCNNIRIDNLVCKTDLISRKRPMSFALLLDVNQSDGDQVGMTRVPTPECPANHIYDPFFKTCKRLACALPGHTLVNGRCVRG